MSSKLLSVPREDKSKAQRKKVVSPALGTQTIQRVSTLLRLLTAYNRDGLRLVDLHQKAGLDRSTTHRILQGLVVEQLVAQHPKNKRYSLGPRVYEMGLAAAPLFNMRDLCHPYIQKLAEATGDTVFLVRRANFEGVCIDRVEGSFPIRVFVIDVGRRRPLNIGAASIAILSTLDTAQIKRICSVNKSAVEQNYPNYSENSLWEKIRHRRENGYVVNTVLEAERARSVSVPVQTSYGAPASFAISISALEERLSAGRIEEIALLLKDSALQIESEILSK